MSDDKTPNLDIRVTTLEQIAKDTYNMLARIEGKLDRIEENLGRNFRWLLGIMLGGFVGLLTMMAYGFKWL